MISRPPIQQLNIKVDSRERVFNPDFRSLDVSSGERDSFETIVHQGLTVAPMPFYLFRATGRDAAGKVSRAYGRYWFSGPLFFAMLDAATEERELVRRQAVLRGLLRDQLAICRDFSDLASFWKLTVTQPILATWGTAKWQPVRNPKSHSGELVGGALQFIVDIPGQGLEGNVEPLGVRTTVLRGGHA